MNSYGIHESASNLGHTPSFGGLVYIQSIRWFSELLDRAYTYDIKMSILSDYVRVALYHEFAQNCPTWTDHTECRCMTEPS